MSFECRIMGSLNYFPLQRTKLIQSITLKKIFL